MKQDYAGFGERFLAHLLDGIFAFVALLICGVIVLIGIFTENVAVMIVAICLGVLLYFAWLFYNNIYLVTKKGGSVGKLIMNMKLVDSKGKYLGWGLSIGRFLIKGAIFMFSIIGLIAYSIPIITTKKKPSLADLILNTYVVFK